MEDGGGEAEGPDGWEAVLGKVPKQSVPRAPLVPRCGEVQRISGATRGSSLGLAGCWAPVPRGTAEAGGVQPRWAHPERAGIRGCGGASRKRSLITPARARIWGGEG